MSKLSRQEKSRAKREKKREERLAIFRHATDLFRVIDTIYLYSAEDAHLHRWRDECKYCFFIQRVAGRPLNKDKASGGCHGFCRGAFRARSKKSRHIVYLCESVASATITPRRN